MTVGDDVRTTAEDGPIEVSPSVYKRLTSGFAGFAVAMAACLVVVGLVLLVTPRGNRGAVPQIDYRPDLAAARASAPYAPQAPVGLPATWYPTSSRLSGRSGGPVAWHLGFLSPREKYAAVEQSNESAAGKGGYVDRMTSQGVSDGTLPVAGVTWQRYLRADKHQQSLVRRMKGVTVIVTGTASYDELAVLAGSLRP